MSKKHLAGVTLVLAMSWLACGAGTVSAPAAPKASPALFGMGAQPCQALIDVAGETDNREIALSGAMFSWAQGWFSARNVVGHESHPLMVGGTLPSERLKALLVAQCREHPSDSLYLAVNDLYERLAQAKL
jgi:hypothetical protein